MFSQSPDHTLIGMLPLDVRTSNSSIFDFRFSFLRGKWASLELRSARRKSKMENGGIFAAQKLAERVRFELTEPAKARQFSRLVHSTALPPLRILKKNPDV